MFPFVLFTSSPLPLLFGTFHYVSLLFLPDSSETPQELPLAGGFETRCFVDIDLAIRFSGEWMLTRSGRVVVGGRVAEGGVVVDGRVDDGRVVVVVVAVVASGDEGTGTARGEGSRRPRSPVPSGGCAVPGRVPRGGCTAFGSAT